MNNLIIQLQTSGYVIHHVPTGMRVTPHLKTKTIANRYLKYLTAGGLSWSMTEQPKNPRDKDMPEVVRFIKLRDARRRVGRELETKELEELLK